MHHTQIQIGFSNEFYHSFHTAIQNKNSYKIYKIKLVHVKQMFYLVFFCVKFYRSKCNTNTNIHAVDGEKINTTVMIPLSVIDHRKD